MIANNSASTLFHSTHHLYSTSGTEFFMAAFQEHFPDLNQSPHTHIGYVQNSILAYYSHYFSYCTQQVILLHAQNLHLLN